MQDATAEPCWRLDSPAQVAAAAARAIDYRGDVALDLRRGPAVVGFVFHADAEAFRLFVPGEAAVRIVPTADIAALRLAGPDAAAGKSWESWLRRTADAELAELYPEAWD